LLILGLIVNKLSIAVFYENVTLYKLSSNNKAIIIKYIRMTNCN